MAVKDLVEIETGIAENDMILLYKGIPLESEKTLLQYRIMLSGSELECQVHKEDDHEDIVDAVQIDQDTSMQTESRDDATYSLSRESDKESRDRKNREDMANNINTKSGEHPRDSINREGGEGTRDSVNREGGEGIRDDINIAGGEGTRDGINIAGGEGTRDGINREGGEGTRDGINREGGEGIRDGINREGGEGTRDGINREGGEGTRYSINRESGEGTRYSINRESGQDIRDSINRDSGECTRDNMNREIREDTRESVHTESEEDTSLMTSQLKRFSTKHQLDDDFSLNLSSLSFLSRASSDSSYSCSPELPAAILRHRDSDHRGNAKYVDSDYIHVNSESGVFEESAETSRESSDIRSSSDADDLDKQLEIVGRRDRSEVPYM